MPRLVFFRGSILIFHWASLSISPSPGFLLPLPRLILSQWVRKYVLIDWVKRLDWKVFGSRSLCPDEGPKFSHLAGPNSVNRHFIIMTVIAAFALFGKHFVAVLYIFSLLYWLDAYGSHTGCFFKCFFNKIVHGAITVACSRFSDSGEDAKVKGILRRAGQEKGKEREPVIIFFRTLWLPLTFGTFEITRFRLLNIWNVNELDSFSNY